MTEREKLLSGLEYNSRDEELIALYHRARALTKSLGALDSHQADEKNRLLGELFGAWGKASWIETPFWCDYGQHVRIGKNCFINVNAVFLDCNTITIGDNTLIGPNVQIYTPSHPLTAAERFTGDPDFPFRTSAQPVSIGSNVWIGGNVVILP